MTNQTDDTATQVPPPPPFTRPRRRLCRNPANRRIGGVASGVASYFGLDTTVVRVLFVIVAAVTGGTAILGYLLAWVLLPEPGGGETRLEAAIRERNFVALAVGALLLLILFGAADSSWDRGWGWGWHRLFTPLALVGAGVALLLHLEWGKDRQGPDPARPTPPSGTSSAPQGPADPSDPTLLIGTSEAPAAPSAPSAPTHPTAGPWWVAPPPPPRRAARPSPVLRNVSLGAACLFAAASTLLGALGTFDVSARFVLGGMLLIVAAGILVSAWWGRRRGLLAAAVLLSIALAVACVPGLSLAGGIGDRIERPTVLAEVPGAYRLGVGSYEIDLTSLALPTDRALALTARLGAGRLVIDVPRSASVDISGHISAGSLRVDDRTVGLSGVDVDLHRRLPAASDAPHLALRIDAAFADVDVRRVA